MITGIPSDVINRTIKVAKYPELLMEPNLFLPDFLDRRLEKYQVDLETCRNEFTETAVHDLRVTTRRLLAALELIRTFDPHPRVKKLRRNLKNQLDGFDSLRDVQVMLADISKNIEGLPELQPFQKYLQKREKRLLRTAENHVRAIKLTAFNKRLLKVRETLAAIPAEDLPLRLLKAVDEAYLTVKKRYGAMDPDRPASIHSLRVAFKKFRYMVECVQPTLPNFPGTRLKSMQNYQTLMGNIHDAEVFLDTLADFSARHDQFDLESIRRLYEKTLAQALSVYLGKKGKLDSFWRAAPETDYPWEPKPKNQESA
jgi:CHAD domain-containing protein